MIYWVGWSGTGTQTWSDLNLPNPSDLPPTTRPTPYKLPPLSRDQSQAKPPPPLRNVCRPTKSPQRATLPTTCVAWHTSCWLIESSIGAVVNAVHWHVPQLRPVGSYPTCAQHYTDGPCRHCKVMNATLLFVCVTLSQIENCDTCDS